VPTKLSRENKRALEQLAQTMKVDNKPSERSSSFFDKVKDIFG
jgi:DnaJ-class molecular chaperone